MLRNKGCTNSARRPAGVAALALALAAGCGGAVAAELGFAHYAPGAGELQLQLDDATPISLNYRDYSAPRAIGAGAHRVSVTRSDGSVLAAAELSLAQDERNVVLMVGNGSEQAPYELRLSPAYDRPLTGDAVAVQQANLAIVDGVGRIDVADCADPERSRHGESYLQGTVSPAPQFGGSNSARIGGGEGFPCTLAYLPEQAEVLAEGSYAAAPGDRLRRFVIGDGELAPFEVVFVSEGNALTTEIPAMPEIAGLWYPPDREAGSAVQIAYDPDAPEGQRLSALMLGFDAEGEPTWRAVDPQRRIVEYRGGNPDGTLAAVPIPAGSVRFVVHSCGSMTLVPEPGAANSRDRFFGASPGKPLRLAKLFPPGCRGSAPVRELTR